MEVDFNSYILSPDYEEHFAKNRSGFESIQIDGVHFYKCVIDLEITIRRVQIYLNTHNVRRLSKVEYKSRSNHVLG